MILHVLRKQESPFLRAGRAEVEGLTRKWTEILEIAVGIGALDADDTLGVVPAENELLNHLGDALDAKTPVDDGVLVFVLIREALKMLFEQTLEDIDSTRLVHCLRDRGELKG